MPFAVALCTLRPLALAALGGRLFSLPTGFTAMLLLPILRAGIACTPSYANRV